MLLKISHCNNLYGLKSTNVVVGTAISCGHTFYLWGFHNRDMLSNFWLLITNLLVIYYLFDIVAGTNTWDRYELRVHKRLIDLFSSADLVK